MGAFELRIQRKERSWMVSTMQVCRLSIATARPVRFDKQHVFESITFCNRFAVLQALVKQHLGLSWKIPISTSYLSSLVLDGCVSFLTSKRRGRSVDASNS